MNFRGFKKLSLIEFPGKTCAIAFTGGCNFRCPWCYVKDLVLNYKSLPIINEKWVIDFLKSRRDWIDALVVSGGEPTIHKELPEFLKKVKKTGFLTGIETNGSNPKMLEKLIKKKLVDYIEMDIKAPLSNPKLYMKAIGKEGKEKDAKKLIDSIKRSVKIIKKSKIMSAFRTTAVPTLLTEKDIVLIAKELKGTKKYYIQQFKPMDSIVDKKFKTVNPHSSEILENVKNECRHYIKDVEIRGV